MFLLLFCLLLMSSPVFGQDADLLSFMDCAGDVICLVQKHNLILGSTEFRTLIRWRSQTPKVNLSDANGVRFSQISMKLESGYKVFKFRAQLQIGRDKLDESLFNASFVHDYSFGPVIECSEQKTKMDDGSEKQILQTFLFDDLDQEKHRKIVNDSYKIAGNAVNKVFVCDASVSISFHEDEQIPVFNTRMRIITDAEIFTYEDDDFWELFDAIAKKEDSEPLTTQYIQYCILILLIYSITVYFLDQYCRRLQYTTMNRVELEEYFFPPARYRTNLNDFHMLRRPTKIEKEKNISAVVPEDILVDFEN